MVSIGNYITTNKFNTKNITVINPFGWIFLVSLFKMMWKLWFKKYCENTYLGIHKAKNVFSSMFQITCFNVWKNIIVCLICMYEKKKKLTSKPPSWNLRRKLYASSNQVGPMFFKIFTKCYWATLFEIWKLIKGFFFQIHCLNTIKWTT